MKTVTLAELLAQRESVPRDRLEAALALEAETGRRLASILLDQNLLTEEGLAALLRDALNLESVSLEGRPIPAEMALTVPRAVAERYTVVPLQATRAEIRLAMADPLDGEAVGAVQSAARRRVVPLVAVLSAVKRAIEALYGPAAPRSAEDGESAVSILQRACAEDARDMRLDPQEHGLTVRMRVDGVLRIVARLPEDKLIADFKRIGRLDLGQARRPQSGWAHVRLPEEDLNIHISILPTIRGERAVIHLLRRPPELRTPAGLGLAQENLERFLRLTDRASGGLLLFTGPAGSGKSASLAVAADRLREQGARLTALEDSSFFPAGVPCRTPSPADALRTALDSRPDAVAIDELRDRETAEAALEAVRNGRAVLAALRAGSTAGALERLLDLGVNPQLLAEGVSGVVTQRLLRRVCPHCQKYHTPTLDEELSLGLPSGNHLFYQGAGCAACFDTGFRGRVGAFEVLPITPAIRRAIDNHSSEALTAAVAEADVPTIADSCRELLLAGCTSTQEVQRVFQQSAGGHPPSTAKS